MTIYDISQRAGVSIATVSRVINGSARVSPATRERVMRVIEESGYSPNVFARGLGLNSMKTIGVLCADCSDPYLAEATYALEQELSTNGYDMLLCCTGYELESKRKYLDVLLAKRVDAVILLGSHYIEQDDSNNDYIRVAAERVPIMMINGVIDAANVYCTMCDDRNAMSDVTEQLLRSGITDILYLYDAESYSGLAKRAGFCSAFEKVGRQVEPWQLCRYESRSHTVADIADLLFSVSESGVGFSAVVAADDRLAIGALKYAYRRGLSVPEQFCVIGYNNLDLATYCQPELTSVDNKLKPICEQCVASLMSLLNGKEVPNKTFFSHEIVKRDTTRF